MREPKEQPVSWERPLKCGARAQAHENAAPAPHCTAGELRPQCRVGGPWSHLLGTAGSSLGQGPRTWSAPLTPGILSLLPQMSLKSIYSSSRWPSTELPPPVSLRCGNSLLFPPGSQSDLNNMSPEVSAHTPLLPPHWPPGPSSAVSTAFLHFLLHLRALAHSGFPRPHQIKAMQPPWGSCAQGSPHDTSTGG